jgi:hypothetical protein
VIFRKRRPITPSPPEPVFSKSAAVPDLASWPADGIAGRIGRGDRAGEWVIASCDDTPFDPPFGYHLVLPDDELLRDDGSLLLVSGCSDEERPDGGGLIDLLTNELDVTWSLDHADFLIADAAWNEAFKREVDQEREQNGLRPFDWEANPRPPKEESESFVWWLTSLRRRP